MLPDKFTLTYNGAELFDHYRQQELLPPTHLYDKKPYHETSPDDLHNLTTILRRAGGRLFTLGGYAEGADGRPTVEIHATRVSNPDEPLRLRDRSDGDERQYEVRHINWMTIDGDLEYVLATRND